MTLAIWSQSNIERRITECCPQVSLSEYPGGGQAAFASLYLICVVVCWWTALFYQINPGDNDPARFSEIVDVQGHLKAQ